MSEFTNIPVKVRTKERFDKYKEGLVQMGRVTHDEALNHLLDQVEKKK